MINKEKNDEATARAENDLQEFQQNRAKEYLDKIRFTIELNELYQVVDSCHSNHNDELCPVLLKLGKKYDSRLEKT